MVLKPRRGSDYEKGKLSAGQMIDNSIAKRFIRSLSGERKNSLFFGSGKMAAVYHTIISTCKMQGVSALQYFKMFFWEIVNGRRDYDNLLPMTIGLGNNKL